MNGDRADHGSGSSTTCPFCGTETEIERNGLPAFGSLSPGELETLVRNEWRRRLGREAYRRPHPGSLVRTLIMYALDPDDPVRDAAVDDALWREVAALEVWGLGRGRMWGELLRLSQAMWDVLSWSELEFDRSRTLMERVDRKVHDTLGWPERYQPLERLTSADRPRGVGKPIGREGGDA